MKTLACMLLAVLAIAACTTDKDAADYGGELFRTRDAFSVSHLNDFSCATCHTTTATPPDDTLYPGAPLYGVAARERFWGGQVLRLQEAVDACVVNFMNGQPLDPTSEKSKALYEFLASITPAGSPTATLPMHLVETITPIALGDATRGADLYRRACNSCHGNIHTGRGQILNPRVILPDVANDYITLFPGVAAGLVFTEVTRHGRFFSIGGSMPPYTLDLLSDAELGDILAYLGTPTQ